MTELRQLTAARGIAAWLVVLYHVRGSIAGLAHGVEAIFAKGYLAVDSFFLLSGFVIWLSWHERLRDGGMAEVPRFLQKRIARIWPLHAAMLAFAAVLAVALAVSERSDPAFPIAELPLHLLLVQNWGLTDALAWNDPAWSISCELAAYLAFPLLVTAVDWRRVPTAGLIAVAGMLLLALYAVMAGQPNLGADIPRFGLVRCLAEFATGTIVAALWLRGVGRHAWIIGIAALTAALLGTPEALVVPAGFAAMLLALAHRPRAFNTRSLHWLGEISYATYLSHFLLWKAFKLAFVTDADRVAPVTILAYLALVLAASALLYHGLERPAQRWVNRLGPVRQAPRRPLPSAHR